MDSNESPFLLHVQILFTWQILLVGVMTFVVWKLIHGIIRFWRFHKYFNSMPGETDFHWIFGNMHKNISENTQTEESYCEKTELFVPSSISKSGACIPMNSHISDACLSNVNCVDNLTVCSNGVCQCEPNSTLDVENGRCFKGCPFYNGYKVNDTAGICYKFQLTKQNWDSALQGCIRQGTHLMRFRNAQDWLVIYEEIFAQPDLTSHVTFWIDGLYDATQKTWKTEGGEKLQWMSWNPNEPSSHKENNLNLRGMKYRMNDQRFSWVSAYICQYG